MAKAIKKMTLLSENYVFVKGTGVGDMTVTVNDISGFTSGEIVEVRNITTGDILCANVKFADGINRLATVSTNVITIGYDDTTTLALMNNTDELRIVIDTEIAIDKDLNADLNIPQAFAPVQSNDYEVLLGTATAISGVVGNWSVKGSEIDVRDTEEISFLITHTHSTSTAVSFRLEASSSIGGTYYVPIKTDYTISVGDTTGTKEIGFDVRRFNYVRLMGYVETAITDTAVISFAKTLNS